MGMVQWDKHPTLIRRPEFDPGSVFNSSLIQSEALAYLESLASRGMEWPQAKQGVEVVIANTSRHKNDREAKWSTTEKESYNRSWVNSPDYRYT
ncbi:hypothetical protein OUZ56_010435 [Daphnia magna]|uniref:Uncharacterized protein n=1 Tax=Daphnia magna TaxID=35525 RepID=A0ABR0AIZ6_9CRUS|nr:hypothetical protein OUZ56_010435 [Daphnia magna]